MRRPALLSAGCLLLAAACSSGVAPTAPTTPTPVTTPATGASSAAPGATEPAGSAVDSDEGYATCWAAPPSDGSEPAAFIDGTEAAGLVDPLTGMHAHAAAFGDVNGDGWVDVFVGTFANRPEDKYALRGAEGPAPDRMLLGGPEGFRVDGDFPHEFGRTSGAVLVDLDGDDDRDLVASRNFKDVERGDAPSAVYENRDGAFVLVVDSGLPVDFGGRSVGVLDYDADGLLDLILVEDRYAGGSTRLFANLGGLRFADVTVDAGLPLDVHGLGIAVGDVTNDGRADFFVSGSNRLFVATGDGFEEMPGPFDWEPLGPEDDAAGAAFGDVDRDGWLDLVVGHHYNSTVSRDAEVPVRLYRNLGGGEFEDVTEAAGLVPLPTKAPHVAFADLDNDGLLDIVTSASAEGGTRPAVFMNTGGMVFTPPQGLGSDQYWVAAPTADVDRDGRIDVLLVEWEPSLPSLLMLNRSRSGHWLEVAAPVGSRVEVRSPDGTLLAMGDISVTQGYTAGVEPVVHAGLGSASVVDVTVRLPDGSVTELAGVPVDQRLAVAANC